MDFTSDADHLAIAEAVDRVCVDFDDTYWAEHDQRHEFPWEFYAAMAEGGWLGVAIPAAYGGGGTGITECAIVLNRVAASGAAMNGSSALHLTMFGLNPVVMKRTVEMRGQNLVRGMQHLVNDLKRGQLTHTDPDAFRLGENLAATPGKVVHETPLYQLIQYSPATPDVLEVPLIIFPPWINRFYILDLTPKKSFIKWAVDQGLTVFVVSWKSADESMADVVWDDYIRAQIDAIDHVRARLDVPAVHTIGYCVAGTTLAATLAILSRRGEAGKVKSATFFTAQVDFEKSGDLKNFIDDGQLEMIGQLSSQQGYLDGRYLAAACLHRPNWLKTLLKCHHCH